MSIPRQAAYQYIERGWAVLALAPRGKRPLTRHGWHDATTDPTLIAGWRSDCNVGIACSISGLLVIDVDPDRRADEDLAALERQHGPLPRTVEAVTGRGGRHIYFRDPGVPVIGKLGEVELKSRHLVVAPPSIHPNGRRYEWDVEHHPDDVGVVDLPAAWVDAITEARPPVRAARSETHDDPLLEYSALEYVPMLTGRTPNARGYAHCPFHEDHNPSLKCYAEPSRGWYCYQCQTGGSIYNLFALLVGVRERKLRGPVFLAVQDALYSHLLGGAA